MTTPTGQSLNQLNVHKVPDLDTWKNNYGSENGQINPGDLVSFPPTTFQPHIETKTITLYYQNWTNNQMTLINPFYESSGYTYLISPNSSSYINYCKAQVRAKEITVNTEITFVCENTPSTNLTVNIIKMKEVIENE